MEHDSSHLAAPSSSRTSGDAAPNAPSAAGSAWQPIATAPKHTPIRLYAQGGGFYDEDFNPSGSVEGHWSDDTDWCGAFWNAQQDCWDRRDGIVPTHWMPLPEPPPEAQPSHDSSASGSPASTVDGQVNKETPRALLSAQGCELATDATKQLGEHSVHLAVNDVAEDFRRRPASSEAAPSAEGSGAKHAD